MHAARRFLFAVALFALHYSIDALSSIGRTNLLTNRRLQPRLTDESLLSRAARELRIQAPWNAPRWLWSSAWRIQTWAIKNVLHRWDDLIKADTFLNLSVIWWKAISGNRLGRTNDGGAAYDILPPWTRLIVSWPLCHLYPNLHHQNVALRSLFLDESLSEVLRQCEPDCRLLAVTLGAGFDTRSLRFLNRVRRPSLQQNEEKGAEAPIEVEMYEVDLPAVVAEKAAVLQGRYLKRNPSHAVPALFGADLNDADAVQRSLDAIFAESARRHPYAGNQRIQVVYLLEATLMYMNDERVLPGLQMCVSRAKAFSALPVKLLFSDRIPGVLDALGGETADSDVRERALVADYLSKAGLRLETWRPKPGRARHQGTAQAV